MKIGLIRHFKVDAPFYNKPLNSIEFANSQLVYHKSPVITQPVNLNGIGWKKCYCSTIQRAKRTADNIYNGEIIYTEKLVEVELSPVFDTSKKLPFNIWVILGRLAWLFGHHSQIESKTDTIKRCKDLMNLLNADEAESILIVSHGFFMHEFAKHLKKNGFKGKIDYAPLNATLYLFERK